MVLIILTIIIFVVGLIFILPTALFFFIIQNKQRKYSYVLDLLNSVIYKMSNETNFKPNYRAPENSAHLSRKEALEILGLPESATRKQINDAYYKLVQVLHPDKGGSTYLTQKLNQARETLSKE